MKKEIELTVSQYTMNEKTTYRQGFGISTDAEEKIHFAVSFYSNILINLLIN